MSKKFTDLPTTTTAAGTDIMAHVQSGTSRQVTRSQAMAYYKANQYDQDLDTTDDVAFNSVDTATVDSTTSDLFLGGTANLVQFDSPMAVDSLTTTQRNALAPAAGWIVFDSTLNQFMGYNGGAWVVLG